jgi:hypothetical protein
MKSFSFVIPSVYTDRSIMSVYTDEITDRIFRIKKRAQLTEKYEQLSATYEQHTAYLTEKYKQLSANYR